MFAHLSVEDLTFEEVTQAFVFVQQDKAPEEIIHALRGQGARLLDPDAFPRDVQRRHQELEAMTRAERNERGKRDVA